MCAAYVSKAEAPDAVTVSNRILKIMAQDQVLKMSDVTRSTLFKCSMALVNSTTTSAQQCAWFLLGYKIVYSSRKVVQVNTMPPRHRPVMLTSQSGDIVAKKTHACALIVDYMRLDKTHPLLCPEAVDPISASDFITRYMSCKRPKQRGVSLNTGFDECEEEDGEVSEDEAECVGK